MSDQAQSNSSPAKTIFGGMALLISFGFIVLILTSNNGRESIEDRSYEGEFTADVTEARWANLEEISTAQAALVDNSKVEAALKDLAKNTPAAGRTDIVVPGSPTFMKQAEAAAEGAPPEKAEEPAGEAGAKAGEAGAAPIEEVKPAKKEQKPKGAERGAKAKGKGKGKA